MTLLATLPCVNAGLRPRPGRTRPSYGRPARRNGPFTQRHHAPWTGGRTRVARRAPPGSTRNGLDSRMRSAAGSRHLLWLALYLFGSFAAAGLGGLSTASAIPTWYRTLRKPGWNPPNAVFGPVWTVLYTFMAVAAWLVRRGMSSPQHAETGIVALRLWWLQLGLNLAWSLTFFGRRRPGWGLVVISMLEVTIIATTAAAARVSRLSAALLAPYAAWTAFASALNFRIWQLNR
jgi:translocator protein